MTTLLVSMEDTCVLLIIYFPDNKTQKDIFSQLLLYRPRDVYQFEKYIQSSKSSSFLKCSKGKFFTALINPDKTNYET